MQPYQGWHWAGDEIVQEPIVPASRKVPGGRKGHYDIDIREFLSTETNAVVRRELRELVARLPENEQILFRSRVSGAFDLRARRIAEHVGGLRYEGRGRTAHDWLFPDETLANGGGDCEDLAFLLAALLEASGISPYCVRVALGVLVDHTAESRQRNHHDHAWVMYCTELGAWQILEPKALPNEETWKELRAQRTGALAYEGLEDVEYVPQFVFNRHHLWNVRSDLVRATDGLREYVETRGPFWLRFDPTFAASVHNEIFDEALSEMPWLQRLEAKAISLAADANVIAYHPFDHFDTAYIDEAWARVRTRLGAATLGDFARAAHAIGDFYAHSFYGEFARWEGDTLRPALDREHVDYARERVYDFRPLCPLPGCRPGTTPDAAAALWNGTLISGQWLRRYAPFPGALARNRVDFAKRRCLPDHDAVAVDGPNPKATHMLYSRAADYARQFRARRQAAVTHIRSAYHNWIGQAGSRRPAGG